MVNNPLYKYILYRYICGGRIWQCAGSNLSNHSWWCLEESYVMQGIEPRLAIIRQTGYLLFLIYKYIYSQNIFHTYF